MGARISGVIAAASFAWLGGGHALGVDASTVEGAVSASNAFGFDFYVQARRGQGNFVCSPPGLAVALTMAAAGASGETRKEILHTLHIDWDNLDKAYTAVATLGAALNARDDKDGLPAIVATRLWIPKDLEPRSAYVSLLRDVFRTPLSELDIGNSKAAAETIKRWAVDETSGRIPQVDARLTESGSIVLTNVAYMTGAWQRPFEQRRMYDATFTTSRQRPGIKIKMMKQVGRFGYAQVDGAKLIELPYRGGISMIVVLPDDSDGLEKIENRIGDLYGEWVAALEPQGVDLELPRFATTTTLPLVDLLKAMGILQAIDYRQASFENMAGAAAEKPRRKSPYIGDAIQIARIETPAPVVTMPGEMNKKNFDWDLFLDPMLRSRPVIFHANHPFMYVVRNMNSGEIIFMGRLVKPLSSEHSCVRGQSRDVCTQHRQAQDHSGFLPAGRESVILRR